MTLTSHLEHLSDLFAEALVVCVLVPALFLIWPIAVGYWGIHVLWDSVFENDRAGCKLIRN